uniref:Uncharacterized protein n=1 Tax=Oryza brachyantha TaxID=4533 RepID=J3MEB4_ORYBR
MRRAKEAAAAATRHPPPEVGKKRHWLGAPAASEQARGDRGRRRRLKETGDEVKKLRGSNVTPGVSS